MSRELSLVPGVLVAAAVAAAAAPALDAAASRREAARLRETLGSLTARMMGERERFLIETTAEASRAAKLEDFAPDSAEAARLRRELGRRAREYREEAASVAVATTLIARRLDAYEKTGVLPPETPDDGRIRRALEWDRPPSTPEVRPLETDLVALAKRLGLPPPPAPLEGRPSAAAPLVARRAPPVRPAPLFMPDRGRGRVGDDPVPALIDQLASGEPRLRALAADELAVQGFGAAPAVPALRRALADADARVRASSAAALGEIASTDPGTVRDLRRLLTDRDEDVRLSARAALERLTPPR